MFYSVSLKHDNKTLPSGIFDTGYNRPDTWGSYIPKSLLSVEDLAYWVTTPMPEAFLSPATAPSHPDSPENLLLMLSARPFVDPQTGSLIPGPGGVSFAVYVILRVLMTGRYLLDCPYLFSAPIDRPATVKKIRAIVTACCALLISDLEACLENIRGSFGGCLEADGCQFIPYPDSGPTVCGSSITKSPPEPSPTKTELADRKKKKQKSTKPKSVLARGGGQVKRKVKTPLSSSRTKLATPDAKEDTPRTTLRRKKIRVDPPWQVMFVRFFERLGKPLPGPFQAAIEESRVRL
ncbi:hypothetical protein RSOLAG1IB_11610 [Rhizoctonia solani AG-1 IB]|uniref:Uncharacterized protein n=1 Tax=Thanatephorus cucumeris (strain AG1-IB / isolate 7/3/14) TaxID=1108050 RepID=A0A0B7FDB4_THACB|nr:hypothetical protein RSOLAG1IB_11610 [Rhizoctonia solani AG-1 IB]